MYILCAAFVAKTTIVVVVVVVVVIPRKINCQARHVAMRRYGGNCPHTAFLRPKKSI